jgi:hypothetical protein
MPSSPRRTLLEPGHEAEWKRLNAEKRKALTPPTGDSNRGAVAPWPVCRRRRVACSERWSGLVGALDPELDVAVAAMVEAGARFVVVDGFAVIANRYVRATEDIDFLVPDDDDNDRRVLAALRKLDGVRYRDSKPLRGEYLNGQTHLRTTTSAGVIDVMRGGLPPLDFETVAERAMPANYGAAEFLVASLQHRRLQALGGASPRPQRSRRAGRDPRRVAMRADSGARRIARPER